LVIPVSAVLTQEAAELTQGKSSRRLGRSLLLAAACHDISWADAHLCLELFDTHAVENRLRLTPGNFNQVAYASSRMLHAWDVPAWIDGRPYIDASYTCSCPALELAAMGCDEVVAISPECGPFYHDLFSDCEMPSEWEGAVIHTIQPDVDLGQLGVHCTQATEDGLLAAYHLGEEKAHIFQTAWEQQSYNMSRKLPQIR
jgi:hypothetical protein